MSCRPSWDPTLAQLARLLVAALVLAALTSNSVQSWRDGITAQDVSYFTNHSNLAYALTVLVMAVTVAGHPRWFDDVRGAIAFYLVMTGLIYALVVAPLDELLRWDIGWTGIVLHRLAPVAALLDWLLTPHRTRPRARRILWWLVYPVVFLAFTWIRGALTGWFPYQFLNPAASSWTQVLLTTAVVVVVFVCCAAVMHPLGGVLRRLRPGAAQRPSLTAEAPVSHTTSDHSGQMRP